MRFERLSEKQLEIFRFAHEPYTALICDGAVRTGKTILMGAAFLTFCDMLSRVLFAPFELPVGILMAFLGAPFFVWLLLRQRGGRGHA